MATGKTVARKRTFIKGPEWERVRIKLFKDNNKYREPLYVSVNDYTALIKRGVYVEVPMFVAQHIQEMEAADEKTAGMIESLTRDFDNNMRGRM